MRGDMQDPQGVATQVDAVFEDNKARDSWLQIAKAVGATNVVQGDRWIVYSPDMATAAVVKTATGGTDG